MKPNLFFVFQNRQKRKEIALFHKAAKHILQFKKVEHETITLSVRKGHRKDQETKISCLSFEGPKTKKGPNSFSHLRIL
jgi:hypothetical protein